MPELSDRPPTETLSVPELPGQEPVAARPAITEPARSASAAHPDHQPVSVGSATDSPFPATAGPAAGASAGPAADPRAGDSAAGSPPTGRGKAPAQWAFRPRASLAMRIGMTMFAIGVLAIVVIMILFASGSHDLPLWLNVSAMLAPLGFAVGMAGVAVDARRSSRALASTTGTGQSTS